MLEAERRDIAIYKTIGFTDSQQRLSFALRFGLTGAVGAGVGITLSAVLSGPIVSAAIKLAGISNFGAVSSWRNTLLPWLIVTLLFAIFAYLAAGKIKGVTKREALTRLMSE